MKIVLDLNPYWKNDIHGDDLSYYDSYEKGMSGSWLYYFIKKIRSTQIDILLAEEYLQKKQYSSDDVIISERRTKNTKLLLRTNACPLIVFTGEPPNADWKFYSRLYKDTKPYKHAFLFSGSEQHISKNVIFHPVYWPNNERSNFTESALASNAAIRKKLIMVSGNNKQHYALFAHNPYSLRSIIRKLRAKLTPAMNFVNLFPFRMDAIVYFSHKNYFDLYGRGWENHKFLTKEESEAVKRLNPKQIGDKDLIVSKYQFALCFENTIFPGYVTEKIFDCFIAGCIPIYYGAPDIDEYIPANTFIDMRDFKGFDEWALYIEDISKEAIDQYRLNINQFLQSEYFLKFTDQYFANELFELVIDHSQKK